MRLLLVALCAALAPAQDPLPLPRFDRVVLDDALGIGYGVAIADVDGDGRPDVLVQARNFMAWYRNPRWDKHVLAAELTELDHVCLAARDLDGDGRAELAAGAGWNPGDTLGSGSLHVLEAPADRARPWSPRALPHEPTVHRMRWVRAGGGLGLVVVPLHGRGNRDGQGSGVRILRYQPPADPAGPWPAETLDDTLHVTHNLDVVAWDEDADEEVLVCSREGLFVLDHGSAGWTRTALALPAEPAFPGASEVRLGRLAEGRRFVAAVEPFHGNTVVAYVEVEGRFARQVLDDSLAQAHALACGDLLGLGGDQVVAGWRERDRDGRTGIKLYAPRGQRWQALVLDDRIACEDLALADLDGDGRLDVVAAGRATHDLVVWLQRPG